MENPGRLVRRAKLSRQEAGRRKESALPGTGAQTSGPKPVSSHANYAALMRSHDRVHTRHVQGQG